MAERGDRTASWRGRSVVVLGLARSGRGAARLLARHGARVVAADLKPAADLGLDPEAFAAAGVDLRLGGFDPALFEGMDLAVVSPGIPKDAPMVAEALRRGIPLRSELDVAAEFAAAPLAVVTGTNGKSTTVTVLGALIDSLGVPVAVAGNVGTALSEVVESVPAHGALVVEASSFQLEDVEALHPRAGAILNLTPDHMDRYRSLEEYLAAKLRLFERMGLGDTAVLPADDRRLLAAAPAGARLLTFGTGETVSDGVALRDGVLARVTGGKAYPVLPAADLSLKGPHNVANAAAALCLLDGLGFDLFDPRVAGCLRAVRGLPHRLEPVGEVDGVPFFNDSKATNPESLEVGLQAFPGRVVLIAGGHPKGGDYARLAPLVGRYVAEAVLIGEAAPLLETAWAGANVPLHPAGTDFEAAVRLALDRARERGVPVLLSPGCASFDMFRDYEDRGDRFRALVRAWEKAS